jgi:poly(A) polymerase
MVLKRIKRLLTRGVKAPAATSSMVVEPVHDAVPTPAAVEPPVVHRGPEVVHHPVALQDLDPDAVRIIKRLTRFDQTAYLVGGCVRDLLLARKPKDFDIGTSATPRQIKRQFSNCRIIGRRFRLAHIYFQNGKIIEVATFRARDAADIGAPAEAGADTADDLLIRDDNIFGTPEEDALRRDFTINSLFYDVNAETVIDHADGLGDLRRRLVRTIGDPVVRFREDPIRILRAVKFAARLDFEIEPRTLAAIGQTRSEMPKAAPPRVLEEINRFCRGGAAKRSFEVAHETGVFEVILPELAETYGTPGAARRALGVLLGAIDARWSAGHDIGTGEIFTALLFAAVAPSLGWALGDDVPAARDGRDARTIVDEAMRPIALRLRVARKDQERVRQALATLQRMVPMRAMRRGMRIALMKRPAFVDAARMLEALSEEFGDPWRSAHEAWSQQVASHGAVEPTDAAPADDTIRGDEVAAAPEDGKGRRRRGRRGGRGRKRDGAEAPSAAAPAPLAAPPQARSAKLPPVWDDDYFFAALPSVPEIDAEDRDTDRYGASRVGPVTAAEPDAGTPNGSDEEAGEAASSPRRRRRRRGGRRHRKAGSILPPNGSPAPAGGEAS